MAEKVFKAACGANITEAHYWRNVTKCLLSAHYAETSKMRKLLQKKLGMSDAEKEERVLSAAEHMARADALWLVVKDSLSRSVEAYSDAPKLEFLSDVDHKGKTPEETAKAIADTRLTALTLVG